MNNIHRIENKAPKINVEYVNGVKPALNNKKRGRRYFEFTHVSGTSNYHIVGFRDADIKRISYYASHVLPDSNVLIDSEFNPEIKSYRNIGFNTVNDTSTIGLGLDLFDGYFYIRSMHQMVAIRFNASNFNTNTVEFFCGEASVDGAEDTIRVNFGEKKFAYNLLPGFTAFIRTPVKISCRQNRRQSLRFYCFYLIVFGN